VNVWKTFGLLVVFGLLLGYVMVYEQGDKPDFEADRTVVQLLGFKGLQDVVELTVEDSAGSFTIARDQQESIPAHKFNLDDTTWKITAPYDTVADATSTRNFLKAILEAKATAAYGKEQFEKNPLSEYGLDQPARTLTVKGSNGKTATMLFGSDTGGSDSAYYAMPKDGDKLLIFAKFAVDENIKQAKVNDLRDKTLLAFLTTDVKKLTLKYPAQSVVAEREGDGWVLKAGDKSLPADSSAIDAMLSTLSGAKIDQFVADDAKDLKAYGLDEPRIEVILSMGKEGERGLLVGATTYDEPDSMEGMDNPHQETSEKLYVMRRGDDEVLQVAGNLYDSLLKNQQDLRDKNVLDVSPDEVTRLSYTVAGKTVQLEKQPSKTEGEPAAWQMLQPEKLSGDSKKIKNVLDTIDLLSATGFIDDATAADDPKYGFDQPQATVEVTQGDKALPKLLFGKTRADGASVYVKRDGQPTVYEVRASVLDDLSTNPNRLRDLLAADIDRTLIDRIELRQKNGDLVVLQASGDNQWKIEKPEPKDADSGRVASLLTTLDDLRGDELMAENVKDADLARYGLDKPAVTATVTLSDKAKTTYTILAGEEPSGGLTAYFMIQGQGKVYKSDHGLVLNDLQKKPEDFEPFEEPPMDMGGMGGMPPM